MQVYGLKQKMNGCSSQSSKIHYFHKHGRHLKKKQCNQYTVRTIGKKHNDKTERNQNYINYSTSYTLGITQKDKYSYSCPKGHFVAENHLHTMGFSLQWIEFDS